MAQWLLVSLNFFYQNNLYNSRIKYIISESNIHIKLKKEQIILELLMYETDKTKGERHEDIF